MGINPEELVDPINVSQSLNCSICQEVFIDPVCLPCSHSFCELCIRRVIDTSQEAGCPICRTQFTGDTIDAGLQAAARNSFRSRSEELLVSCVKKCSWIGPRCERAAHWFECPLAQRSEYFVEIEKLDDPKQLGLEFQPNHQNVENSTLVVLAIYSGALKDWNNAAKVASKLGQPPKQQVATGDALVEVNGVRGDPDELSFRLHSTITSNKPLRLVFRRPTEFTFTVNKGNRPLGLDIDHFCKISNFVVVKRVKPNGSIADCILRLPPCQLYPIPQDRVLEVNGIRGSPEELINALKSDVKRISLTLHRYK